jgi:uncharacterized phosphosugar-binding protein
MSFLARVGKGAMMNKYGIQFSQTVAGLLKKIDGEYASINKAATLMSQVIMRDELIHVIGTGGHSNIGTYELFMRAGGLAAVNGILDPGTLLSSGGLRSTRIERTPGYAAAVLDSFDVKGGVLVIINAYGINAMTIDSALEAKPLPARRCLCELPHALWGCCHRVRGDAAESGARIDARAHLYP